MGLKPSRKPEKDPPAGANGKLRLKSHDGSSTTGQLLWTFCVAVTLIFLLLHHSFQHSFQPKQLREMKTRSVSSTPGILSRPPPSP